MLEFANSLTIPPDTPEDSPVSVTVKLTEGIIKRVLLEYKAGCAWFVHVQAWVETTQLLPVIPGQSLAFDNYVFETTPNYKLVSPPYNLTVFGWSPNTDYQHIIDIIVGVEPEEETTTADLLSALLLTQGG